MDELPRDPEFDFYSDLAPASLMRVTEEVLAEAETIAHLEATGMINRLVALVRAHARNSAEKGATNT